MSATLSRMDLAEAEAAAERFVAEIADACEQIVVAGSIRRRQQDVGDIEIVVVPATIEISGLFAEYPGERCDVLDAALNLMANDPGSGVERRATNGHSAWGPKYKRLSFEGAPIDLFSCDADRFGLILAIRTGPAWYSHQLVTPKDRRIQQGERPGLLPPHMKVTDGWLTYRVSGQRIPTPTEEGFFETIGQPYIEPWERR